MKPAANPVTTSVANNKMSTKTEGTEAVVTKEPQEFNCCPLSLHQKIIKTFNWILMVSTVFENHPKCRI